MNFDKLFSDDLESSSSISNAAKTLKAELKRLEKIEQRRDTLNQLFKQVALASRLKAELQICSSERSSPIVCSLKLQHLSLGKSLILVNLKNDCNENLIGWQLIVHLTSMCGQMKHLRFNYENFKSTLSLSQVIPLLKHGCSVDLNVYCTDNYQLPVFVKCFLAKTFLYKCPNDNEMKSKTFQIFVHSELFTILDLVGSKSQPTFVPNDSQIISNKQTDSEEIKFCFSLAILKCLRKEQYESSLEKNARFLLKWFFPNVNDLSESSDDGVQISFNDFNVDSNVSMNISFNSSKSNEILMLLGLTGMYVCQAAKMIKFSILAKYLRFVNDCLKVAKTVDINLSSISFALQQIEQGDTQDNVVNILNYLTENVLSKLPLA